MAGSKSPLYLGRSQNSGGPVIFSGEGALLTVGPPGTGKSRGVAIWNLLHYPGSMLVTDPKGQLVRWSAQHRQQTLGQTIAVLDPFGLTDWPSASINPFSPLVEAVLQQSGYRTQAERLAHLLLPDVPGSDPYWRSGGRDLLITGLLYLAAFEPDHCTLPGLHDVLMRDEVRFIQTVLEPMSGHPGLGGALDQYAAHTVEVMAKREKNFGVFRQEARAALSIFAADEPCGRTCAHSTLDLSHLIAGRLTVYLVLPPDLVSSHGRWMGIITAHALQTIMRQPAHGDCVFLLDEFANLGRLSSILEAVAQLREKGLRVWLFVQDLAQLEAVYGRSDAEALRAQAEVLQVLGCRSADLARYIELRAGTTTEKRVSYTLPSPLDPNALPSRNLQEEAVPVLPAAKALNLPIGQQILIRHGFPVILADVDLWTGE